MTSSSTSTLRGSVNAESFPVTSCAFLYGPTTKLGSKAACTPAASAIAGGDPTPVLAKLAKLKPGTKYYVALAANGAGGLGVSKVASFTTKAARPTVSKSKAGAIKSTSAKLSVTLNPGGAKTTVVFNYGPTAKYGKHSKTVTIKAGRSSAVTVSVTVSKLTAETTYHARAIVKNSVGSAKGKDFTFTTKRAG